MIHLDTSFLIRSLVPGTREDQRLREWLRSDEPIGVSAIVWTEFLCGPLTLAQLEPLEQLLGNPEPYGVEEAALAASLFNAAGRRRGSLLDCMIAAAAMHGGAELATSNPDDFQRLTKQGLRLI